MIKTIIFSGFSIESQFIKEAFSNLELVEGNNYSWYKGKLVGKEILFIDLADKNFDMATLQEILMTEGGNFQAISIDLGKSLNNQLRTGDIIINDFPQGSFQDTIDFLLDQEEYFDEPMRIFVGDILTEGDLNYSGLACLELQNKKLIDTLKTEGIYSLLIRPVIADNENSLEQEKILTIAQQIFHLVKRSIEKKI